MGTAPFDMTGFSWLGAAQPRHVEVPKVNETCSRIMASQEYTLDLPRREHRGTSRP
jgi:hypothetical protein